MTKIYNLVNKKLGRFYKLIKIFVLKFYKAQASLGSSINDVMALGGRGGK